MYQLVHIRESMCIAENETRKNNISNSYWNYSLEHSKLFQERLMEESRYVRIDSYWNSINGILNEFAKPKYTQLFALAKASISWSQQNVVSERGFSVNIYLLSIRGNSIDEKTIVALRLVKDFICSQGAFSDSHNHNKRAFIICETVTFKASIVFGNPTKLKWKWRKFAFGEREEVVLIKERERRKKFFKQKLART